MAEITGGEVVARCLKLQGLDTVFGIVGFPVYGIARSVQKAGLRYFGFRNEQAASYAAGVAGYLTGRPGCCLTVSGPGMIHGIAGLANATINCWPMLLLGGASESYQAGSGAFQEAPQLEAARPFVKYAARPDSVRRIPFYVEQAVRTSLYGRPGAAYLDLPDDLLLAKAEEAAVEWRPACAPPPRPQARPEDVERALAVLRSAQRPLVVVGKGAAYADAAPEVRELIERTGLPFLATPMGKGVVSDDHPASVASARSFALEQADVALHVGARFNWILHFGLPPRWRADLRVVQIDIAAEEISTNVPAEVGLVGDAKAIVGQLLAGLERSAWRLPADSEWPRALARAADENRRAVEAMEQDNREPIGYYRALRAVRERLPREAMLVCEGANTMDIARTVLPSFEPRRRLDAGTFGTMGVGAGSAIAAAAVSPGRRVVAVQGDSAFGFSAMEVEVACRYNLPITFVVINNNGIGSGVSELDYPPEKIPTWVYTPGARYELIAEAFGGRGFRVERLAQLDAALEAALAADKPAVVNVLIDPEATRKPQKHAWLTR